MKGFNQFFRSLLRLVKYDLAQLRREVLSLIHRMKEGDESRQLRKNGFTCIQGFTPPREARKFGQLLRESYGQNLVEGLDLVIPSINRRFVECKQLNDGRIKSTLRECTGQRIERFRFNGRIRVSHPQKDPIQRGDISPVVFKAYLLLEDTDTSPFAVLAGSHRFSFRPYKRLFKSLFYPDTYNTPIQLKATQLHKPTGKAGDLLLLNLNTYHQPITDFQGKPACQLEWEYMVISRLRHLHQAAKANWSQRASSPTPHELQPL